MNYDEESHRFKNVSSRALDVIRDRNTYNKRYHAIPLDDDNSDPDYTTFDVVHENYVRESKRSDQRQLIDDLLEHADAQTTAIVRAWLDSDRPTLTSIGSQLGLHHETVRRKLAKLARYYDEASFGDYREYLSA
ncbi:hypothetical protein P4631_09205 [Halalkalibacterium halodurans]|uniref:hypothetical protein n=1 Tax=Halalkalibacterium halodurans TaxID=86665 RepID=UPI002E2324D2|nr:hypothetical protein [Halalkalibacterium halodurans]